MQKSEASKLLGVLRSAYPAYYKSQEGMDFAMSVDLWAYQFQEYPFVQVFQALNSAIAAKEDGFPPSIGEVKVRLREITSPEKRSADKAWDIVMKAVRRGSVHAQEDWEQMPEDVRQCITPDRIRSMSADENFNESVEMSLFYRTWNAKAEQRRVENAVPLPIREAMTTARTLAMEAQPQITETKPDEVMNSWAERRNTWTDPLKNPPTLAELMEKKRRELEARNEK